MRFPFLCSCTILFLSWIKRIIVVGWLWCTMSQSKSSLMFGVAYLVFVLFFSLFLRWLLAEAKLANHTDTVQLLLCLLPLVFVLRFPVGVTLRSNVWQFYIGFNGTKPTLCAETWMFLSKPSCYGVDKETASNTCNATRSTAHHLLPTHLQLNENDKKLLKNWTHQTHDWRMNSYIYMGYEC